MWPYVNKLIKQQFTYLIKVYFDIVTLIMLGKYIINVLFNYFSLWYVTHIA
jgi:hypothetical protein